MTDEDLCRKLGLDPMTTTGVELDRAMHRLIRRLSPPAAPVELAESRLRGHAFVFADGNSPSPRAEAELRKAALAYAASLLEASGEAGTLSAIVLLGQIADELAP